TGSNISAILHDMKKLIYFNKITEKEFEMGIRTQRSDVERVYISVIPYTKEGKGLNRIYELERYVDYTNSFDYFKRMLTFSEDVEGLEYFFILEDGGVKNYYGVNGLEKELSKPLIYSKKENEDIFYIPYWSREAIWYNIFPDRFYNGDVYNDPIFNEFGPEKFRKNSNYESKFVKDYRWNNNEYA
ncbi:alpha amylase N-terminal ig-like domain-containing protein, partial [Acinetobacter baumannii]|nr:alpha amylase N-terminal ig-like domain-containing protein [Acinetobacter baumannii]